jgi:hypothetical protein
VYNRILLANAFVAFRHGCFGFNLDVNAHARLQIDSLAAY